MRYQICFDNVCQSHNNLCAAWAEATASPLRTRVPGLRTAPVITSCGLFNARRTGDDSAPRRWGGARSVQPGDGYTGIRGCEMRISGRRGKENGPQGAGDVQPACAGQWAKKALGIPTLRPNHTDRAVLNMEEQCSEAGCCTLGE